MTTTTAKHADLLAADLDLALDPAPETGPQAQGDLTVLPWPRHVSPDRRSRDVAQARPVPPAGIAVVRGRGGNTHLLVDPRQAGIGWYAYPGREPQTVGALVVPDGAVAYLDHAEHGRNAIGPGVYVIRRQREQADEIRLVAD